MDDVAKAIPYNRSEVRFIFKMVRVWARASLKGYGVILKLGKIQLRKNMKIDINDDFIDSEHEELFLLSPEQ